MNILKKTFVCLVLFFLASDVSVGQTFWTAGVDDWYTPGNWTLGVPVAPFDAVIANDGTAQILAPGASVNRLRVGRSEGPGHLLVDGGTLNVTDDLHLNEGGTGIASMIVQGGSTVTAVDTVVVFNSAFDAAFQISGAGTVYNATNDFTVGRLGAGAASLYIDQGAVLTSVTSSIAPFGGAANSTGIVNGPNSRWSTTGAFTVGSGAAATLFIEDQGTVHVGTALTIGATSNVNVNGGTLRLNTVSGLNRLNFTSGTIQLAGDRHPADTVVATLFGANPVIPSGKGLTIEGSTLFGSVPLTVSGGQLNTLGTFNIGQNTFNGLLQVSNGGVVTSDRANLAFGIGESYSGAAIISGLNSRWTINNSLGLGVTGGLGTLTVLDRASVFIGGNIDIREGDSVSLNGGTIRFDGYYRSPSGAFYFSAGTVQLAGNRSLGSDLAIADLFGPAPTIPTGKGLTVEQVATLQTPVVVNGGTLTVGELVDAELLDLQRGTLNITNQAATVGSGGTFETLEVGENVTINVTLGLTNSGLVIGDGRIGGMFTNAVGGELRAQPGRSLALTGTGNSNDGQIKLLGGELEFTQDLTNNAGGFISGNGSILTGGLTNVGTVNFAGTANIVGDVTNVAGGKIISGGGGATIFFDDVTNDGEIRTSTNGFTVFFGDVTGAGSFTGTGTVNFEGDLNPGNSAATVSFGGDVAFGVDARLEIELGGLLAGSQYDQILVGGDLALAGSLDISLIDGFTPSAGQSFDILDWGTLSGTFSAVNLPAIPGLAWDLTGLYIDGVVSVLSAGPAGDFDGDGDVDGRDFLIWQRGGSPIQLSSGDLADWQTNYGVGSLSLMVAVPEPSALAMFVMACCSLLSRVGRSEQPRQMQRTEPLRYRRASGGTSHPITQEPCEDNAQF